MVRQTVSWANYNATILPMEINGRTEYKDNWMNNVIINFYLRKYEVSGQSTLSIRIYKVIYELRTLYDYQ